MADRREEMREQRVHRDLGRLLSDRNLTGINIWPDLNDIRHLTAIIDGPVRTPYEGGIFNIDIILPEMYPIKPPRVRFVTKIWHPNICHRSGAIRMKLLRDWSPSTTLRAVVLTLQALLSEPDLNEPLEEYVMSHYRASLDSFNNNARYYTEKYATERNPPPELATKTSGTRITRMPKRLDEFLL